MASSRLPDHDPMAEITGSWPSQVNASAPRPNTVEPAITRLAGTTTMVITYDRSGLGASPPRPGGRGVRALTEDLAHTIEIACSDPAVVVGHSLGATLPRSLAATRPDLVAGLVLIDPIPDQWVLNHARWAAPVGAIAYRILAILARLGLLDMTLRLPLLRGVTRSNTSPSPR